MLNLCTRIFCRQRVLLITTLVAALAIISLGFYHGSARFYTSASKLKPVSPPGMKFLLGGTFEMGSKQAGGHQHEHDGARHANAFDPAHEVYDDEGLVHSVTLAPFFIDIHEVTNEEFVKFVEDTYRVAFRGKSPPEASFNNVGFRCAKDAEAQ
jgi:formylglycine-generating enzyme required for sulfatase activity